MRLHENWIQPNACYRIIRGCSTSGVMFESYNLPGYFISNCDNTLKITNNFCGGDTSDGCWLL